MERNVYSLLRYTSHKNVRKPIFHHSESIQVEIHRLANVENSWLGKIVLYKTIILPKILYVLRTIPISIPNWVFQQFHKQMYAFIWQNRRPCLSFSFMTKRMHLGGGHRHTEPTGLSFCGHTRPSQVLLA